MTASAFNPAYNDDLEMVYIKQIGDAIHIRTTNCVIRIIQFCSGDHLRTGCEAEICYVLKGRMDWIIKQKVAGIGVYFVPVNQNIRIPIPIKIIESY